jgi:hypothetical protein
MYYNRWAADSTDKDSECASAIESQCNRGRIDLTRRKINDRANNSEDALNPELTIELFRGGSHYSVILACLF